MNKHEVLQRIARYLMLHSSFTDKIGLFDGKMGVILFFMNYARYTGCKRYEKFAGELIDEIYTEIHIDCSANFGNGLAGIAWGMEYLIRNHFVKANPDEVLKELDSRILERDVRKIKDFSIESGLKGIAYYVINRCSGREYPFIFKDYMVDLTESLQMSAQDDKESLDIINTLQTIINKNEVFKEMDFLTKFIAHIHTGEITPLKYSIPNRIVNRSYHVRKDKSGIQGSFQINIYPLIQNTSNIMITEFADDTLYSLKNKKLYPIMIKKPSAHKMTPPILVGVDLITNRYIFINTVEKNPNEGRLKQTSMVYDKQSADFYQLNLLNKDCSYKRFINMYGSELLHNTGISSMGAEYLLQDYKAGKLQGELKQIASKLKEDDNPILMLIKFKR